MDESRPLVRRDLQYIPVQHDGQSLILVRDPLGLVPDGRAIAPGLLQLMLLFDGTMTIRELQMALMREQGGVLVGADEVEKILSYLDEAFFLDSVRFKQARDKIVKAFSLKRVRPPSHSGQAYPGNADELRKRLDRVMAGVPSSALAEGKLTALVSPHIDLSVGERVYGSAYQTLRRAEPSTVVILGVGHSMGRDLFSLTEKDYLTPLGRASTDLDLVRELRQAGGTAVSRDDFAHRSEHSIEFQVIFLQHLLTRKSYSVVPILCGSLQGCLPEYSRRAYREATGPLLERLKEIVANSGGEVLLLAGVDLCHVGPKFGHETDAAYLESQAKNHDRALLEHLTRLDADGFWETSRSVSDRYNVCGFSALSCLIEVVPQSRGVVLSYDMWHERQTRSAVSFAAAAFFS
jgi:AmmeMemoRadiSam system protein B